MDEMRDRLRAEMEGEHAPAGAHERVRARIRGRERRRRVTAASLGLGLTGLLAFGGYAAFQADDQGGPPTPPTNQATRVPSSTGTQTEEPTSTPATTEPPETLPGSPPLVTVRFDEGSVQLAPYTYCYGDICVDGAPKEIPNVGSPERVTVEFPLRGWSFTAYFTPAGDDCGRVQSTPLTETDPGSHVLEPVGFAGEYDVTLFGEAERGGDLFVAFGWSTPFDGPLPEPRAYLALLANDDPVTSYGLELHVSNLAATPSTARAFITVRASNGRELTFEATEADGHCQPDGTVYWDGPDAEGLAAAELGQPPFTYEVEVILDGIHHVATATWPDDEIVGEEPAVHLEFTPALPALGDD